MTERGDGVELLLDVGLDRRATVSAEVEIDAGDGRCSRRQVMLLCHSPNPQEIDRALATLRPHVDGLFLVRDHTG